MKEQAIGTYDLDRFLHSKHVTNDMDFDDGDFEIPKECYPKPSKFTHYDLKVNGKQHPKTDDMLRWQYLMTRDGRYDEIPDDPNEVIKMFDENPPKLWV